MQTLFDRYGGFAMIRRIVSDFYDRCLESELIAHHFEAVDMTRLIDHQAKFIASVTGGPASYSDEQLRRIHAGLRITHDEFAEMTSLLRESLEDHGFSRPDVASVMREITSRESAVVAAAHA